MELKRITSPGLAHHSWFLSEGGEALVVDPRRDVQVYLDLAKEQGAKLTRVLETHRNEDYAVGSTALQQAVGAKVLHSKRLDFEYGESVGEKDEVSVGRLRLTALETPGHTPESLTWVLRDPKAGETPLAAFTGDALFFGDTGRVDLMGEDEAPELAAMLHRSVTEKILPLGDQVALLPGHGPGSVCGGAIADRALSTLGYEKIVNEALTQDREAFVDAKLGESHVKPPHFERMEEWNLRGNAPVFERLPVPVPLSAGELQERMDEGVLVIDAREPAAFAAGHVPGSVNVWFDGLSAYASWVAPPGTRVALILPAHADAAEATRRLVRIGLDDLVGVLRGGFDSWAGDGRPVGRFGTVGTQGVKKLMSDGAVLLDVRQPSEWESGTIDGAEKIFAGHLEERLDEIPDDRPVIAACSIGNRGGLAASILARAGREQVLNYLGGLKAWRAEHDD